MESIPDEVGRKTYQADVYNKTQQNQKSNESSAKTESVSHTKTSGIAVGSVKPVATTVAASSATANVGEPITIKDPLTNSIIEYMTLLPLTTPPTAAVPPKQKQKRVSKLLGAGEIWDVCPYRDCDSKFRSKCDCEKHLETTHLRQVMYKELGRRQQARGLDPSGVECPDKNCGYIAPLRSDLVRHFSAVHRQLQRYIKRHADRIPGANFDQLRASGFFKGVRRCEQLKMCPHCERMVAEKHMTVHMLYKHFFDFFCDKIQQEQSDFGVQPGECPVMGCGKSFKLKQSQDDLLRKHYVLHHFSIAEAEQVTQPVVAASVGSITASPAVDSEEENILEPKKEEPDSADLNGAESSGVECPFIQADKSCPVEFFIYTDRYLTKIMHHLAEHWPSRDLVAEAVAAACQVKNLALDASLAGHSCPLDYCPGTLLKLTDHFVESHLLELVLTVLTLHWRPSRLLTALLKDVPYRLHRYFKQLKSSLQTAVTDTTCPETVESTPDLGSLFPDIKEEIVGQLHREEDERGGNKEDDGVLNEEDGGQNDEVEEKAEHFSVQEKIRQDAEFASRPTTDAEKCNNTETKPSNSLLRGEKSGRDGPNLGRIEIHEPRTVADIASVRDLVPEVDAAKEERSSSMPPVLRQYLAGLPVGDSQGFSAGSHSLTESQLHSLQVYLFTNSELTSLQIDEVFTYLASCTGSDSTPGGISRDSLRLVGRHAGLLKCLYNRHRHEARSARRFGLSLLDQVSKMTVGNNLNKEDTGRLTDWAWSLLYKRPSLTIADSRQVLCIWTIFPRA